MGSNLDRWRIEHIPGKPQVPPDRQPVVDVVASPIEPKLANAIVRRLNQIAPLEDLRHVKRVQKKCIEGGKVELYAILCIAPENSDLSGVPVDVQELISSYQLSTFITKVCKYAALSKEEWEAQCKLWPTSYHPPTYNISGISGFSEEDHQYVVKFMKLAIDLATNGNEWVVNAAVIVNPVSSQVIASASDQACQLHLSMEHSHRREQCSISSMAHDNGFYNYDFFLQNGSSNDQKQRDVFVSCLSPWSWADKCSYSSWHPLHHAAMVAIESSAERDLQLFPSTSNGEDKASDLDHALYSAGFPAKRQKTKAEFQVEDEEKQFGCPVECKLEKPYLCTGYDIFLVWEPCVMCAMALVHQRVRRIFYAFPNASTGALGSVQRLQGEKSLNHHYAAFRIFMPQDYLISAFSVA